MKAMLCTAGIIAALAAALAVVGRIDMEVQLTEDAERAAVRRLVLARELLHGYEACPPEDPDSPATIVLVIRKRHDGRPEVVNCVRIGGRSYITTPRKPAVKHVTTH